jgi:hypothetical protein
MDSSCSIPTLSSKCLKSSVSIWNSARINGLGTKEKEEMKAIIDEMGIRSANAQRLKAPVTDYKRLLSNSHQLYLWTVPHDSQPNTLIVKGLLKTGVKNLYIRRQNNQYSQISPTCVLDFYVHESCQRTGIGKMLFEAMLDNENKLPHQLGYDRPSSKLMNFLVKHYHLSGYIPQVNQFVVFNAYFDDSSSVREDQRKKYEDNVSKENSKISKSNSLFPGAWMNDKRVSREYQTKLAEDLQTKYSSESLVDNRTGSAAKGLKKYCVDKGLSPHSTAKDDRYNKMEGRPNQNEMFLNWSTSYNSHSSTENRSSLQSVENSMKLDRDEFSERKGPTRLEKLDHRLEAESCKNFQLAKRNEEGVEAEKAASKNLMRTAMTSRICYRIHLSGSGVADALGLSKGVYNR